VAPVTLNIHQRTRPPPVRKRNNSRFPSKSNSFSSCWRTRSSTRNNSRSLQVRIPHHASAPGRETIRVPSKSKTFSSIMLAHQFLLGIQFPCPSRSNTIFMLLAHQVQHKIHFASPGPPTHLLILHASAPISAGETSFVPLQLTFIMPAHRLRHIQFEFPPILRIHAGAPYPARDAIRVPPPNPVLILHASAPARDTTYVISLQFEHSFSCLRTGSSTRKQFAFPSKSNSFS